MTHLKMPDINNVLIAGKLMNDPTVVKLDDGRSYTKFYLISSRKYKDNSGIWRDSVCNVGVTVWDKVAEASQAVLKKGHAVLVSGELLNAAFKSEDGSTKNVVELHAYRIQFLDQQNTQKVFEYFESRVEPEFEKPESEPQPESAITNHEIKVEATEFDFGYQDLKI